MTLPWFRFYHEFAGDPIVQCLAFEDQRHFVMVLCLKGSGFLDREFPSDEFRTRMVCHALGLDPVAGSEAKRRLSEVGLIDGDWHPKNWDKRQFQSDNSAERVRNWRAKQRETLRQRNSNARVTPQDTDTDTDTEQKKRGTARKRASALPTDFGLTPARSEYAAKTLPNVDTTELLAAFCDHHTAKGTVAKDWDATWRTWVRNSLKFGYPMPRPVAAAPAKREPTPEQLTEARRRAAAENVRQLERLGLAASKPMPT